MIELAPRNKSGLPVENPILLAGGVIGDGLDVPGHLRSVRVGAVVVGPITRRPRRGASPPRLAETAGGFVLQTGLQNRGVDKAIRLCSSHWKRMACPVVAQVADTELEDLSRTARQLERSGAVAGLELLVDPGAGTDDLGGLVTGLVNRNEMPLWVKLPYARAISLAETAVRSGADALVICQPPSSAYVWQASPLFTAAPEADAPNLQIQTTHVVSGALQGPAVFGLMLDTLIRIAEMRFGLPLIACGGIHSWSDASIALAAGASAVQLDGAVWIEPSLVESLTQGWAGSRS